MLDTQVNLSHWSIEELFETIQDEFAGFEYDFKKHLIHLMDDSSNPIGYVRLPLHLEIDRKLVILRDTADVLYLTIESGYAAICVMNGLDTEYHTTFSAYMTRKKQGFSQIKYLNKKGKSRAGSRIRLAETVEFFENINTTVTELMEEFDFDRVALNCNKTLLPYLLQSKVPFPLEKQDKKLYKIPVHIPQSNYTQLDAAIKKLRAPVVFYDRTHEQFIQSIFS